MSNSFWDTETSGQATSAGGTGKTTVEMQNITTFSGAAWDIVAVGGPGERVLVQNRGTCFCPRCQPFSTGPLI